MNVPVYWPPRSQFEKLILRKFVKQEINVIAQLDRFLTDSPFKSKGKPINDSPVYQGVVTPPLLGQCRISI